MTFSPLASPTDPRDLLAHMGAHALAAHLRAALDQLAAIGVDITPAVRVLADEVDEAVLVHEAARDPLAVPRALARAEAELAAGA